MRLHTLEKAGGFLSRNGLQINLDELFRMNIAGYSRNAASETAVVKALRKHLSTDEVCKSADVIRSQAKET